MKALQQRRYGNWHSASVQLVLSCPGFATFSTVCSGVSHSPARTFSGIEETQGWRRTSARRLEHIQLFSDNIESCLYLFTYFSISAYIKPKIWTHVSFDVFCVFNFCRDEQKNIIIFFKLPNFENYFGFVLYSLIQLK